MLTALLLPLSLAAGQPFHSTRDAPVLLGSQRVVITDKLEHPWAMAWLPDGRALITERPGRLRLLDGDTLVETPVAGVPTVFAMGQGGLLDVAVHPDFAQQPWVYLTYSTGTAEANRTEVGRGKFVDGTLSDWQVLYRVSAYKSGAQHFGARMAWKPDGTLLVSIGDGGNPPLKLRDRFIREHAQELDLGLGKILRLNADGSIPKDNPHVGKDGVDPAIWSHGHRNIQGLAVDRETGTVYANEHGALGGDELNRIEPGANYGWPKVSWSREYVGAAQVGSGRSDAAYTDPLLVWETATGPSGLMVYRGSPFKDWQGKVFSGSLVKQDVRVLTLDESGAVAREETLRFGARVRDVREGPDGAIYVLTDERNGRLFKLTPMAPPPAS
jgi:glucose/arabinose dehydrogenase